MPLSNPQPSVDQNSVAITGGTISGVTLSTSTSQTANIGAGLTILSNGAIQTTGVGGGSVAGNARGSLAIDLQSVRFSASHVASGASSIILGGDGNTASGTNAAVIASQSALASGSAAIAMGGFCQSTGERAIALGNTAGARRVSELAFAGGGFSFSYNAQASFFVYRVETTNATPAELLTGRDFNGRLTLSNDSTCAFSILVSARRTDADNESAAYKLEGCIDRNTNAASTALVGSVAKTVLAEDTVAWDFNVSADTTNGSLKLEATGEAAKTIRWVAFVTISEVIG